MSQPISLLEELAWRGLLYQQTEGLAAHLATGPVRGYCGFDPTAASLHVGNLVPVMGLVHLARAGHTPVALVGGGTAMIGDPSGKANERTLMTVEKIDANAAAIHAQLEGICQRALGQSSAPVVLMRNNAAWLRSLDLVSFLRDTGKHFSINYMLAKDSVASRLENGISFTEFAYMLMQAYDFLHLSQHDGVSLQIGGSDQWGNMTAGTELIRRALSAEAFAVTLPLVTTSSGQKFGKTEAGAVWLDASLTSPYQFYQFWINAEDADVGKYLRMFTLLDQSTIEALEASHAEAPHERRAQRTLAREVTTLLHSAELADAAERASRIIFDKKLDPRTIAAEVFEMLSREIPLVALPDADVDVLTVLEQAFAQSRGAGKKLLQQGAVMVNGAKIAPDAPMVAASTAVHGRWFLVRKGARDIALVKLG